MDDGARYVAHVPRIVNVILLIAFIVILGMVLFSIWRHVIGNDPQSPTKRTGDIQPHNRHDDTGSSENGVAKLDNGSIYEDITSCSRGFNRAWNFTGTRGYHCDCLAPFYGPSCNLEAHDSDYYALGDTSDLTIDDLSSDIRVDRLSFPFQHSDISTITCTGMCNDNPNCVGVMYTQHSDTTKLGVPHETEETSGDATCMLLGNEPIINGDGPKHSHNEQSKVYLKRGFKPTVQDRVYLFHGILPRRFWQEKNYTRNANRTISFFDSTPMQLFSPNLPDKVINDIGWYGVITQERLTSSAAQGRIFNPPPDTIVITPTTTSFRIPDSWSSYWGVFFPFVDPSRVVSCLDHDTTCCD